MQIISCTKRQMLQRRKNMSLKKLVGKDVTVLLDGRALRAGSGTSIAIEATGQLEKYTSGELLFKQLSYPLEVYTQNSPKTELKNVTINREYVILIGQAAKTSKK